MKHFSNILSGCMRILSCCGIWSPSCRYPNMCCETRRTATKLRKKKKRKTPQTITHPSDFIFGHYLRELASQNPSEINSPRNGLFKSESILFIAACDAMHWFGSKSPDIPLNMMRRRDGERLYISPSRHFHKHTDSEVTAFMAQRLSGLVCDIHICSLLLFICASHLCERLYALDLRQSFTVLT